METQILQDSVSFLTLVEEMLKAQDEDFLCRAGSLQPGGRIDLNNMGDNVWLEQFQSVSLFSSCFVEVWGLPGQDIDPAKLASEFDVHYVIAKWWKLSREQILLVLRPKHRHQAEGCPKCWLRQLLGRWRWNFMGKQAHLTIPWWGFWNCFLFLLATFFQHGNRWGDWHGKMKPHHGFFVCTTKVGHDMGIRWPMAFPWLAQTL